MTIQILHLLLYPFYPCSKYSVFSASSVKSLSNTVSVSLQLLFLSSFLLFKHLHPPLQFFNQLFLILLLLFLLQPLSVKEFDRLFKLQPLPAKVSDHLFMLTLAEKRQWGVGSYYTSYPAESWELSKCSSTWGGNLISSMSCSGWAGNIPSRLRQK
jgi:hypothetical protein